MQEFSAPRHVNREARAVDHVALAEQTVQGPHVHMRRDARKILGHGHERHRAGRAPAFQKFHGDFITHLCIQDLGELGGNNQPLRRQHYFAVKGIHHPAVPGV